MRIIFIKEICYTVGLLRFMPRLYFDGYYTDYCLKLKYIQIHWRTFKRVK